MSTHGNSLLECPNCHEPNLIVVGSDVTEQNVGIRRYQCQDCRNRYTALESFFLDDRADPDCFLNIALNHRLRERENHRRRTGKKPRRQLKPTDRLIVRHGHGTLSIQYKRSPRRRAIFLVCKRGHDLTDPAIRYVNPSTQAATCRLCRRINQRDYLARRPKRDQRKHKPDLAA